MSKRPTSKIQFGEPSGASPGETKNQRGAVDGSMAPKIAIGAVLAAVMITLVVFATKDEGGDTKNTVAFQQATVEGTPVAQMPSGEAIPAADPAVGTTIPTVSGKNFNSQPVTIEPGKPQIIAFLAHWCPHCQAEVPKLVEWQSSDDFPEELQLVAVSTSADEKRGNFPPASWLEKEEWTNTVLVDTPDGRVMKSFGGTGFPTLIAVTADGKIAKRGSGELTLDQLKALGDAALGKIDSGDVAPVEGNGDSSPVPES